MSAFFVILVPDHANEEHLRILATVSEMFSDKAFRDRLDDATEPAAIQRLFGEWTGENDFERDEEIGLVRVGEEPQVRCWHKRRA